MNNWRLLLLAVVAVFQPIASFTESNLIDGRQQCCDRLLSAPIRDTKSSLHGIYRLDQTTSELRRLNDRDEIHDRRNELKQRDSIFGRSSTERRQAQERVARQDPSLEARSTQIEYRLVGIARDRNHDRLLDIHERERTARNIRDLKAQDLTRRVVNRISRDTLEHHYDRDTEASRGSLSRNYNRVDRFTDRLSKNLFDSQRENQREQFRSGVLRVTLNRDARHVFRTNNDAVRIEINAIDNRQHISRERLSVLRRNFDENNQRRERNSEQHQRRPFSETQLVNRNRDMRIRLNSREENNISANQLLSTERVEERREQRNFNKQNKENNNRRLFGEQMLIARRKRESRIMNERNIRNEREIEGRQEIGNNERISIERQDRLKDNDNARLSHERIQIDRRTTRGVRIINTRNERDENKRREIRHTERIPFETIGELRNIPEQTLSHERVHVDRRNTREARILNIPNEDASNERREIRDNARMYLETREKLNSNQRLISERIQIYRRNIRETRMINNRIERNVDDRQNERIYMETRDEVWKNPDHRLSRERAQIDRKNTREARIINIRNERDLREIRHNSRISRDTRDERKHYDNRRLSLERVEMDRRNFGVINNVITQNYRDIDSRMKIPNNERLLKMTRDEIRDNFDDKLSLERIQMERRNIREFRTLNTPNMRDMDNRQEIRYSERRETEIRENNDYMLSRERNQMDRRNTRENRFVTRNERDAERRREIMYDERLPTETSENPEQRLSRDRVYRDLKNTLESRAMDTENSNSRLSRERVQIERANNEVTRMYTPNEKVVRSRQEIRYNERLSTRDEIRDDFDRQLIRENRQTDRRDIHVSRIINSMTTERDIKNIRDIRFNERLSRLVRSDQFTNEHQVASRSLDRVFITERENTEAERRIRSVDLRNFREIKAASTLSRSADLERRSEIFRSRVENRNIIENREREAIDARSRNVDSARNRGRIASETGSKMETENHSIISNWQYVMYTLQAAYLCALFTQMLTPSRTEKTNRMNLRWLPISTHYNPIKVD